MHFLPSSREVDVIPLEHLGALMPHEMGQDEWLEMLSRIGGIAMPERLKREFVPHP
jgi:hypothetical protein